MRTRTAAAVAVVALLLVAASVQLADPQFGERTPPEVDFTEPPAAVAADAATQFEYVDYAYRIDFARNRSGPWRQVRTMQVDHSDREYYKTGPAGDGGVVLYGSDSVAFVRPTPDSAWRVTFLRDVIYPVKHVSQPLMPHRIRDSNATVVSENHSSAVISVDVHPLKVASYLPGNATLSIDKQTGLIDTAEVAYDNDRTGTNYLRFSLTETGTQVDRPDDIPFSFQEFVWDLLRGPLVNL